MGIGQREHIRDTWWRVAEAVILASPWPLCAALYADLRLGLGKW